MDYIFHFGSIFDRWDQFLRGTLMTIQLAVFSTAFGLVIAVFGAIARTFGPRPVRWLIAAYVELIRNTPLLVQLYIVFFLLPGMGLRISGPQAAIVGLSANLGAYAIEIIRAGIEATPRGQIEAGMSLGLSRLRIIRHIVLIPALRAIYPALGSQFVLQLLGSSLASAISVEELKAVGDNVMMQTFRNFEVFIVVGVIYFILVQLFQALSNYGDRRLFRWTV
jgi:polar amino acid transport system permease protein